MDYDKEEYQQCLKYIQSTWSSLFDDDWLEKPKIKDIIISLFKGDTMDTYFFVNPMKCTDCFLCVPTCPRDFIQRTEWFHPIFEETIVSYDGIHDYVPCHHCDGFWEDKTPCQEICPADAIELSRW